jgi:hypothetical protein
MAGTGNAPPRGALATAVNFNINGYNKLNVIFNVTAARLLQNLYIYYSILLN